MLLWKWLWALPCSLVGILLGLPVLGMGARCRRVGRSLEIAWDDSQACAPAWANHCKFTAITLGHVIIGSSHEALAHWRAHERVHVAQYECWGIFFFLAYPAASVWAWAKGEGLYRGNWFEKQAYKAEGLNSGFCVDLGL